MRVPTTTFQNTFGKYLKLAIDGEDVIVTKNGRGVAKLIHYNDPMVYVVNEEAREYYIRKRVTYEEFIEITEKSEARYELIDGELYMLASPSHSHQMMVTDILVQLFTFFAGKKCIPLTAPYDVKLHNDSPSFEDDPNIVQPDILVICDEENVDENDRYQGTPSLVVEVTSKSTRNKDIIKKLDLYMKSGVGEYWLVDAEMGIIHVYFFENREIEKMHVVKIDEPIYSLAFEGLVVNPTGIS